MSLVVKAGWLVVLAGLTACGGQSESGGTGGSAGTGASAGSGGSTSGGGGGSGAVDGGSGGTVSGGSGGVGAMGGAPGGGGAPCSSLATAYDEALKKAKACNPAVDMEQCTSTLPDALDCPCAPTYVNPANAEALKTLGDLKYFWDAQKCSEGIACPAIACEAPVAGSCQPDAAGATGTCEDMFTNAK